MHTDPNRARIAHLLRLSGIVGSYLTCSIALAAEAPASARGAEAPAPLASSVAKISREPRIESPAKRVMRKSGASIAAHGPIDAPADVAKAFGLLGGTVFHLAPATVGDFGLIHVQVVDPRTGAPLALELRPRSVRAKDFKMIGYNDAGQAVELPAGESHTVGGRVAGIPDSRVAGSYHEGKLTLAIDLPDGERLFVDALSLAVPGSLPGDHIAYTRDDLAPNDHSCGVADDHRGGDGGIFGGDGGIAGDGGVAGAICEAQIVIDCDFPFFTRTGSFFDLTGNRVETIISISNLQYESEVSIRHVISGIVIRNTAATDPYVGSEICTGSAADLTVQNTVIWGEVQGPPFAGLFRDMVHLFTGRPTGGIVGCAWVGDVCTTATDYVAHGVSQIDYVPNTAISTDLFAHEAGHNWGAGHCTCSSPPSTMNAFLTGANTFQNSGSAGEITTWRNTHSSCLDCANAVSDGCGDVLAGSSWAAHPTRYSNDANCCAVVCANDGFCCEVEWDAICVNRALITCAGCGAAGAGSPYVAHGTPGCTNVACCGVVCAADPYCCDVEWDIFCVVRAEANCRSGDSCAEARLMGPGIAASGNAFNTLEGVAGADITLCGTGDTRATWRKFTTTCAGWTRVSACTELSEAQMTLAVFEACGEAQLRCSATPYPGCPYPSVELGFASPAAGRTYYIRVSVENGLDALGTLSISCSPVCGNSGAGSCTATHGPGCSDAECCATVCNLDPYCCTIAWDSVCVGEAGDFCFRAADLDRDGDVDAADLSLLLASWGTAGGDVDGNGTTDAADLSMMLADWG